MQTQELKCLDSHHKWRWLKQPCPCAGRILLPGRALCSRGWRSSLPVPWKLLLFLPHVHRCAQVVPHPSWYPQAEAGLAALCGAPKALVWLWQKLFPVFKDFSGLWMQLEAYSGFSYPLVSPCPAKNERKGVVLDLTPLLPNAFTAKKFWVVGERAHSGGEADKCPFSWTRK